MDNVISNAEMEYRRGEKSLEKARRTLRKATELERLLFDPLLEGFADNHKQKWDEEK